MGQVQEEIKNLHSFQGEKTEYVTKAKEILKMLVNQPEIYTIQSQKNSRKDLLRRSGKIFCGINDSNNPCLWLFSEKQYANAYAEHFGFKVNDFLLTRNINSVDLQRIILKAMFKGVKTIRIDEGFTYLNTSIYDFLNAIVEAKGEEAIIKETDKPIINFLVETKLKNISSYIISDTREIGQQSLFDILEFEEERVITKEDKVSKNIVVKDGIATVYKNIEDAQIQLYARKSNNLEIVELDINDLSDMFNELSNDNEVKTIKFVLGESRLDISLKKVSMITNKVLKE